MISLLNILKNDREQISVIGRKNTKLNPGENMIGYEFHESHNVM